MAKKKAYRKLIGGKRYRHPAYNPTSRLAKKKMLRYIESHDKRPKWAR